MTTTDTVHCECGGWSGERCEWEGPETATVTVEYMPERERDRLVAARYTRIDNTGPYPVNGALRLRCERSCAARIIEEAGDWARIVAVGDANSFNVWRSADELSVWLGSAATLDEARVLAAKLGGDQIQRGLDGEVEGVQRGADARR